MLEDKLLAIRADHWPEVIGHSPEQIAADLEGAARRLNHWTWTSLTVLGVLLIPLAVVWSGTSHTGIDVIDGHARAWWIGLLSLSILGWPALLFGAGRRDPRLREATRRLAAAWPAAALGPALYYINTKDIKASQGSISEWYRLASLSIGDPAWQGPLPERDAAAIGGAVELLSWRSDWVPESEAFVLAVLGAVRSGRIEPRRSKAILRTLRSRLARHLPVAVQQELEQIDTTDEDV
ncbi:MAG: hypothetical protein ACHQ50_00035 [Fimbriimonadales bacterium]